MGDELDADALRSIFGEYTDSSISDEHLVLLRDHDDPNVCEGVELLLDELSVTRSQVEALQHQIRAEQRATAEAQAALHEYREQRAIPPGPVEHTPGAMLIAISIHDGETKWSSDLQISGLTLRALSASDKTSLVVERIKKLAVETYNGWVRNSGRAGF
jgi:hypothetical protein